MIYSSYSSSFSIEIIKTNNNNKETVVHTCYKVKKKNSNITYSCEIPIGLYHHTFVETLLRSIQQSPLFLSEVHMHFIVGHCILKYPIHVYNRKHDTNNTIYMLHWQYIHIILVLPPFISWHRSSNILTKTFHRETE